MNSSIQTLRFRNNRKGDNRRRSGFTLIELMVVLAIAGVVTSITIGGYREMTDGNKRTTCQTNLRQIYQGLRLYANDQNGLYPPYDPRTTPQKGIGLWALYAYPKDPPFTHEMVDVGNKPVARYIRNPKVFHCPADNQDTANNLYADITKTRLNPDYLSYQLIDDNDTAEDTDDIPTYLPGRIETPAAPYEAWKRQLLVGLPDGTLEKDINKDPIKDGFPDHVPGALPQDDTIVTWCLHHRNVRDRDNVLFYDGSVQLLPREQDDALKANCDPADSASLPRFGAARLPKRSACE
jgi:prepilin-type N-terminal cleavage/methylation domain-containing protein